MTQVMAKREQFRAAYASCTDDDQRQLCIVMLAQLFTVQCESLLAINPRSAFCLAATAHAIAADHPLLMQLLVANLQKVSWVSGWVGGVVGVKGLHHTRLYRFPEAYNSVCCCVEMMFGGQLGAPKGSSFCRLLF
jgi:hypothetical protein